VAVLESYRTRHFEVEDIGGTASSTGKNHFVHQMWFESGGVVSHVVITLVACAASFAFSQLLPTGGRLLLNRFVLAPRATSQNKLNALLAPPRMPVGTNYAKMVKAVTLGIIFAPLYPPLYLFTAGYLFASFYATRFGIAYWYARPPSISEKVHDRMRVTLAWMVGFSLILKRLAYSAASADPPLYLSFVLWLCFMLSEAVSRAISAHEDLDTLDTHGKKFRDVAVEKFLDSYVCPKLRRGEKAKSSGRPTQQESGSLGSTSRRV